jgi:hypothetical protein
VEELDFEHFPVQNGFPGIPVKAWIRFPNCAEPVDGEVYAWTAKEAEATWKDGPVTYRTWVWSSAVTRREEMMNRNLGERTDRDSNSNETTLDVPVEVRFTAAGAPLAIRYDGRVWAVAAEPVHWFTRDSWWETQRTAPVGVGNLVDIEHWRVQVRRVRCTKAAMYRSLRKE